MKSLNEILNILYDFKMSGNTKKNRIELCKLLTENTGYEISFYENVNMEIYGDGMDIFNLQIEINNEKISFFKYLNDYDIYERSHKLKILKKKIK